MKRYLIFGGQSFYPFGGFADLVGDADTVDEAIAAAAALEQATISIEWWHIIDMETRECVRESDEKPLGGGMGDRELYHVVYMGGHLVPAAVEMPY